MGLHHMLVSWVRIIGSYHDPYHGFVLWVRMMSLYHGLVAWVRVLGSYHGFESCIRGMKHLAPIRGVRHRHSRRIR